MARCGIDRIDQMFQGAAGSAPVGAGDTDRDAVRAAQDLLRGHGIQDMPDARAADYGTFGPKTQKAVQTFRAANGLPGGDTVDSRMLQALVANPAPSPAASRPYLALALDFDWDAMLKVMALTAVLEGGGRFGAINANTDGAGLSYGIIQWAQKPGRLNEILRAMRNADPQQFTAVFGGGQAAVADGLMAHTANLKGGVDDSGATTDPAYNLVDAVWAGRFRAAALLPVFQKAQVTAARSAFDAAFANVRKYAPDFTSERAVAFTLDLGNQFGPGGAQSIYTATAQSGQTVAAHLQAMANESVRRMKPNEQAGTQERRRLFLETGLLSDDNFETPAAAAQAGS